MNYFVTLPSLMMIATLGGLLGCKLKIPAGAMVGAMLAVIIFKMVTKLDWDVPRNFNLGLQILLGLMVGSTFHPDMLKIMGQIIFPVVTSTLFLVGTGLVLSLLFTKFGILDIGTAYLGTSPGAMSALIVLALDNKTNPALVTCFHFFRVVFIILTTPLIFKFFFFK